jgi:hypothetical protein
MFHRVDSFVIAALGVLAPVKKRAVLAGDRRHQWSTKELCSAKIQSRHRIDHFEEPTSPGLGSGYRRSSSCRCYFTRPGRGVK